MDIIIIDGQGAAWPRAHRALRAGGVTQEIVAVGTNARWPPAPCSGRGASPGATGENAVIVTPRGRNILAGPHQPCDGKQHAGRMQPGHGPAPWRKARLTKVLIPVAKCRGHIAGLREKPRWPNT